MAGKTGNHVVVAAIDFGTTFSGYAFSFLHEFQKDPTKIRCNHWIGGSHISLKAPSCVLFTPRREFHSFGYDAEDKYTDLSENDDHTDWFYFRQFKMLLHNNETLTRQTELADVRDKPMKAMTVFAAAIRYLKKHLTDSIEKSLASSVTQDDIHWVLTVPAIWNESAKQFMRESAIEAGIVDDKLSLSLEPEAASVYCKHLPVEFVKFGESSRFGTFQPGTTYMVLDFGGGTVDITVHTVQPDGGLSEVTKASGGPWGGTQVDNSFLDFLREVIGADVLTAFKTEHTGDFIEMMRDFEMKKRKISMESSEQITLRVPPSIGDVFKQLRRKTLKDHLSATKYSDVTSFRGDKMKIDAATMKSFFIKSISNTVDHVKNLLKDRSFGTINTLLLVGGFAESEIVQEHIKTTFSNMSVVIPNESGLAVLKGAVMFGHKPKIVVSRVSRYTYGVEVINDFEPGIHSPEYKIYDSHVQKFKCKNIFNPFVHVNEHIPVDHEVTQSFTSDIYDCTEGFGVYASPSPNPKYIVERGCFKLGTIKLQEPGHTVIVKMKFGDTEFSVVVTDLHTGAISRGCFDFLTH